MDQRDEQPGDLPPGTTPTGPTLEELRAVNEQLLIAGLREQDLAAVLEGERASLAAILACIPDGVMVVDPQGQPVLTNAAYRAWKGRVGTRRGTLSSFSVCPPPNRA